MTERIVIDGLKEFRRDIRNAADSELPKRLGRANKAIGEFVIRNLHPRPDPRAVGEGRGASVRPSATRVGVNLKVGGAHRDDPPRSVWGRVNVRGFGPAPERPHIIGTAAKHADQIIDMYLEGVLAAMDGAFADTEAG